MIVNRIIAIEIQIQLFSLKKESRYFIPMLKKHLKLAVIARGEALGNREKFRFLYKRFEYG